MARCPNRNRPDQNRSHQRNGLAPRSLVEGDFSLAGEPADPLHHQVARSLDLPGELAERDGPVVRSSIARPGRRPFRCFPLGAKRSSHPCTCFLRVCPLRTLARPQRLYAKLRGRGLTIHVILDGAADALHWLPNQPPQMRFPDYIRLAGDGQSRLAVGSEDAPCAVPARCSGLVFAVESQAGGNRFEQRPRRLQFSVESLIEDQDGEASV